jgi:DNA-directed RNA polymerase subunit beta'
MLAENGGKIHREDNKITVRWQHTEEIEYEIESAARLRVQNGDKVKVGEQLTEGVLNPNRILRVLGREAAQVYLLGEVQKVYRSQGVLVNDKHIEVIIRQMTNKVRIVTGGDSDYLAGELLDYQKFQKMNEDLMAQGKRPASARPILLGITKAALSTESFLSASSFQHTINVLAQAAIEGKRDDLFGLKENVILGKLIPAGTGYHHYHGNEEEAEGGDGELIFDDGEDLLAEAEGLLDLDLGLAVDTDGDGADEVSVDA